MICEICNKEFDNYKGLSSHIRQTHNITSKYYYDKYLKKDTEGICPVCGKETPFIKISKGYQKHCCQTCSQKDPKVLEKVNKTRLEKYGVTNFFQNKEIQAKAELNAHSEEANKKKIETSQKHYGVDNPAQSEVVQSKMQQTNLERYGSRAYNRAKGRQTMKEKYDYEYALQVPEFKEKQEQTCMDRFGVYNAYASNEIRSIINENKHIKAVQYAKDNNYSFVSDLIEEYGTGWYQAGIVNTIKYNAITYVDNKDIPKIIQYVATTKTPYSALEKSIVDFIKTFYDNKIVENSKLIINPKELDIYLPDLKLAIEFNGNFWHSQENGFAKDYHLKKSLMCRDKGIRLIHIYEFEDLNKQKQLLKDLILGQDNYPKEDFNKNNLITHIPEPTIIYQNYYTIYGAGPLY